MFAIAACTFKQSRSDGEQIVEMRESYEQVRHIGRGRDQAHLVSGLHQARLDLVRSQRVVLLQQQIAAAPATAGVAMLVPLRREVVVVSIGAGTSSLG